MFTKIKNNMKNRINSLFYSLLVVVFAVGCAESDDYSTPDSVLDCVDETVGKTANITGTEVYAMANSSMQQFPEGEEVEDMYLEAYITSSDGGGNFFKSISMETEDGKGFSVPVDIYNYYTKGFEVGRKVLIKLNGLYYQINHNSLIIGVSYTNPTSGAISVGRTPENMIPEVIFKSCEYKTDEELVYNVTIAQAKNNDYINKLIELDSVQFVEMGLPYYDPLNVIGGSTNRNIIDKNNNTVIFRTGSFATYAGYTIPHNSGKVRGVMTKFNSDFQFVARVESDIKLDRPVLGDEEPEEPEIPGEPSNLLFAGADFEDWALFNSSINSFGLKDYAVQGVGAGIEGGASLHLNGNPSANDYVFTILASAQGDIPANPTKITFWVKGVSTGKSISINVYRAGSGYDVFNVGDLATSSVVLSKANLNENTGNGTNSYGGAINTGGQWVKVTLDISDVNLNTATSGDLFALKVGHTSSYDIHIDNIEIQ
jgi:hypothetical protein